MGNVCNCKQLGLTKDMTSDVEVEQTIIKKKSANDLKMLGQTVMPSSKPMIDFTETKKQITSKKYAKLCQSCKQVSSFVQRKRSKTTIRRSVFFNRTFINIAILGERRTGKSCYVTQLLENRFSEEYVKSKENERKIKRISYKERNYNLNINIPLSDKEFDFSTPIDFYLVFFDSTSISTFDFAQNLFIKKLKDKNKMISEELSSVIFVSNKNDLSGISYKEECVDFCQKNSISFFEISIKRNKGLKELNNKIIEVFDTHVFNDSFKAIK